MRLSTIVFLITFCFFTSSQSQSINKLSDSVSFYTSFTDITIEKTLDSTTISNAGIIINSKDYLINGVGSYDNISLYGDNTDTEFTIYNIKSDPKYARKLNNSPKDTDSLFIVLDTIYGWGLYMKVYIDQETNHSGVIVPTWTNSTFGYVSVLEHGYINIAAILPVGLNINIVLRDSINFNEQDTIYLSASEAIHQINYEPVDKNGNPLGNLGGEFNNKFSLVFDLSNGGFFATNWSWYGYSDYFISDYHGEIDLYFGSSLYQFDSGFPSYLIEYPEFDSITQSISLSNEPNKLANAVLNYTYYAKRDFNKIGFGNFSKHIYNTGNYFVGGILLFQEKPADTYWEGELFMDMQDSDKFGYCLQNYMGYVEDGNYFHYIASPYYDEYNDSIAGFWGLIPEEDTHYINDYDTLFFGKGASFYWSSWSNFSERISCYSDNMGIFGNYFYQNYNTDTYKIKDKDGNIIIEGSGLEIFANGLEAEQYTVELTNSFCPFDGYVGSSSLSVTFDKSKYDPNPPPVSRIQLLNNDNTMKYHFEFGEDVLLKFSASDFIGYNEGHVGIGFQPVVDSLTTVSIKSHYSADWSDVDIQKIYGDSIIGSQYKADLSTFLTVDSAMYDLKIYVEDYSGNSSEYTFNPAFIYGDFMVGIPDKPNNSELNEHILITPNPAHDFITISNIVATKRTPVTYEILSTIGRIAKKGELSINTSNASINISDLTNGLYIIVLYTNNNLLKMSKIIKM